MDKKLYACACLKDGKLLFCHTGYRKKDDVLDFNKDFYFSGLNMAEEIFNYNYDVITTEIDSFIDDKEFYRQFELDEHYDEYNGERPY